MKKIFILTGEPSGDKLASTAISKVQKDNKDIVYLSGRNVLRDGVQSDKAISLSCIREFPKDMMFGDVTT